MSSNYGYPGAWQPAYRQQQQPMMPFQQGGGFQFGQTQQPPGFQPAFPPIPSGAQIQTPGTGTTGINPPGMLPIEQSYIENILRLNKGRLVTVYMAFEGSTEWNSKVFRGIIEAAGRDHLILSDPETGYRYLLPMIYFNYAVFEEEIEYEYPLGGFAPGLTTTQPR
ncbi:spore coat protein GerQ [Pallidibacillus pasinlerensis]|nr:spore coat protein GerQ [Pallidibacillus pasinlerensis]